MTTTTESRTAKYVVTDTEIVGALDDATIREAPLSLLEIALRIAGKLGLEPEWLPGPYGNGVAETDTQRWGRVVSLHKLRQSLDRLTADGVLVSESGSGWRPYCNGRSWGDVTNSPNGRFWATRATVTRWADEDTGERAAEIERERLMAKVSAAADAFRCRSADSARALALIAAAVEFLQGETGPTVR